MPKELFPLYNEENLLETYWARNSVRSQIIYITILLILIGSFVAMFLIKVNVTIHGTGIIRPELEKTEIKTLCSGNVNWVGIREGEFVFKRQELISIDNEDLTSKLKLNKYQIDKSEIYIRDLEYLTNLDFHKSFSKVYNREYQSFREKLQENKNKQEKAKRELDRITPLFKNGLIAEKEYDDLKYQLSILEKEYNTLNVNQLSAWQSRLENQKRNLKELENQKVILTKELEKYSIISPVDGYVEHFKGIVKGANVQAGQTIAVVSPNSGLIAEIYVAPKDIGLINREHKVLIQIDAFNYNQWGMLNGEIDEISRDFILLSNRPVFRIKCKLNKNFLTLKNGFKGNLKKGMTLRARFLVTERTLFQLLFDKVDNWLNPATN
jgi:multidrug resistance efflux pump